MYKHRLPMELQFFAEEPAGTDPEPAGTEPEEQKPLSFDDFLKTGSNQAEFDRRVSKAVQTAQAKWQAQTDDKLSEAEKLAKMTAAEKAQYMQQKKEKELNDREAEITRRELMATAKNTLADKKLPQGLAELLNYTSADECNKSIDAVEKAFQSAVEDAVRDRLKGSAPPKKAPEEGGLSIEDEVRNALKGSI